MIRFSFKLLLQADSLGCSDRGQSCFSCKEAPEPHIWTQSQNHTLLEQKLVGHKRREGGMVEKNCQELEKTRTD